MVINRKTFLFFLFLVFAIRPILDIQGKYIEGEGVNLGGIIGALFFVLVLIFMAPKLKAMLKSETFVIIIFSYVSITVLWSINILVAGFKESSLVEVSRFLIGFAPVMLVFYFNKFSNEEDNSNLLKLYKILIVSCSIPVIIVFLQLLGYYPYTYFDYIAGQEVGRPTGGFFQPNSLGRLMIFVILISYVIFEKNNAYWKYFITFFSLTIIFLSTHRTSLIIAIVLIAFLELSFSLLYRKIGNVMKKAFLLVTLTFVLMISFSFLSGKEFILKENIAIIYETVTTFTIVKSGQIEMRGRGKRWEETIKYMQVAPIEKKLIGMGYQPFEPHNDILRIYVVNGFVGIVFFLVIFSSLFLWMWKQITWRGKRHLISLYVYIALFSVPLQPTGYPYFMWLFFWTHIFIFAYTKRTYSLAH